jgi:hypothetical protein
MIKVLMAMIALGMALSVAACGSAGLAQPAPSGYSGGYLSNPLGGGGG